MTTLRRELRLKFTEILKESDLLIYYSEDEVSSLAEKLADACVEKDVVQVASGQLPLEWKILAGMPVTENDLEIGKIKKEAKDAFEQQMNFGTLPWGSTKKWDDLEKFIVQEFQKDPNIFLRYRIWQKGDGKYVALSNKKIRENPDHFISCFPDFLAHTAMYRRVEKDDDLDANGIPFSY